LAGSMLERSISACSDVAALLCLSNVIVATIRIRASAERQYRRHRNPADVSAAGTASRATVTAGVPADRPDRVVTALHSRRASFEPCSPRMRGAAAASLSAMGVFSCAILGGLRPNFGGQVKWRQGDAILLPIQRVNPRVLRSLAVRGTANALAVPTYIRVQYDPRVTSSRRRASLSAP